jgi:Zn-dependent peptidase ImmA (M78 family)
MVTPVNLEQATALIIEHSKQLVDLLIETRGHNKPPFLSEEFAHLKGIKKIIKSDLGELSAILLRFSDGYVIKVNEKHSLGRQNFSCAHELGHLLISDLELESRLQTVEFRTFNPQAEKIAHAKAKERLCDIAAKELLMPEAVFKQYLSEFGISIPSIERLANIFRVSIKATAIRIAEVSPKPCISLLWKHRPKKRVKGLQLAWCIGPRMGTSSKTNYEPVHKIATNTSALYQAYQGNNLIKCHKLFKIGTTTRYLPMESKGFGYDDKRFVVSLAFLNS